MEALETRIEDLSQRAADRGNRSTPASQRSAFLFERVNSPRTRSERDL